MTLEKTGKMTYIRVEEIDKAKTGKHGAAKVMVTGKVLGTGKKYDGSFKGDTPLHVVTLLKKSYVLLDILEHEDSLYIRPNDTSSDFPDTFPCGEVNPDDLAKLKEAFEAGNRGELTFSMVSAPGFVAIDDIKAVQK